MESRSEMVTAREDRWVEIPAETADDHWKVGNVELRPGADETRIRLKATSGGYEQEVEIEALERGIALIRKEHER